MVLAGPEVATKRFCARPVCTTTKDERFLKKKKKPYDAKLVAQESGAPHLVPLAS